MTGPATGRDGIARCCVASPGSRRHVSVREGRIVRPAEAEMRRARGNRRLDEVRLAGDSTGQTDRTIAAQLSGASGLTYKGSPGLPGRDMSGSSTIQPA
jgi:hypothetical protein